MKRACTALLIPLLAAACGPAGTVENTPAPTTSTAATSSGLALVPAGATLMIQLDEPIGSMSTAPGSVVTAHVISPARSTDGDVVIPVGAVVEGFVAGYLRPQGNRPALVGVDFHSVDVGGVQHGLTTRVTGTDLAIADSDVPTRTAGAARLGTPSAMVAGAVITDPGTFLGENELGLDPGSILSLGSASDPALPAGARLTLEVLVDAPLPPNP